MKNDALLNLAQFENIDQELSADAARIQTKSRTQSWFAQLGETLAHLFFEPIAYPAEPQIDAIEDRGGTQRWRVYNPAKRQTLYMTSEQEVRIWLDTERYSE